MFKYLRISITDRCNYRCLYCMPKEGIKCKTHDEIMRYEDVIKVVKVAADTGVEQVRITGGEPLIRKGVVDFISQIAQIKNIKTIAITTNGALLSKFASQLKEAGLHRVNISLDSLNAKTFFKITRAGNLIEVKNGIFASIKANLHPVKLNTVIIKGINDNEILDFADFAVAHNLNVRFIELMPFGGTDPQGTNLHTYQYVSENEIAEQIKTKYNLIQTSSDSFGPSRDYLIEGTKAKIGFISSKTHPFCSECKRLRLTADGYLLPCLDSSHGIKVTNKTPEQIKDIICELYELKQNWHRKKPTYTSTYNTSLSKIGG